MAPVNQSVVYYLEVEAVCYYGPGTCSTAATAGVSWVTSDETVEEVSGQSNGWTSTVALPPGAFFGFSADLEDGDSATNYILQCVVNINGVVVASQLARGSYASASCDGTVPG